MKVTPLKDFAEASMPAEVMKYVNLRGWKEPTLIQAHCWPVLNAGRDVIGIAETGSGKTLGFSLPAMAKIFKKMKVKVVCRYYGKGSRCLAVAREAVGGGVGGAGASVHVVVRGGRLAVLGLLHTPRESGASCAGGNTDTSARSPPTTTYLHTEHKAMIPRAGCTRKHPQLDDSRESAIGDHTCWLHVSAFARK